MRSAPTSQRRRRSDSPVRGSRSRDRPRSTKSFQRTRTWSWRKQRMEKLLASRSAELVPYPLWVAFHFVLVRIKNADTCPNLWATNNVLFYEIMTAIKISNSCLKSCFQCAHWTYLQSISCSEPVCVAGFMIWKRVNQLNELISFQRISNPAKSFKCHLCETKSKTPQMLLWHLASQHFKDDILAKNNLDASSRICPICCQKKTFLHLHNLVIHLAQRHNQLQGLVDIKVLMNLKKDIREFKREVPTWLTKKIIHPLSQQLSFNWEYSLTKLASLISYTSSPFHLPLSSAIIDFIEGNWKKMHLRFEP